MDQIDIQYIRENNLILFEAISGSKAYGLDTPESDEDIKGIFILPKTHFFGLDYTPQVSDETNDTVYYEIGRFAELLIKNNPTVIELINSPTHCVRVKNALMDAFTPEIYLSKNCQDRFAGYAMSQIKKAKGLNKKIHNPMDKERKSVLDFCFVNYQNGSISLKKYLYLNKIHHEQCGLVNIPQMQGVYGLYHEKDAQFGGIIKSEFSNDITLSSVPKSYHQKALLYFNKDGYSFYCKSYKEYWDWVAKRNEKRYENTITEGKNYDTKNMMHTFRLLQMAKEIGTTGKVNVLRPNRDFLLGIKKGQFDYDVLMREAELLVKNIRLAFEQSTLPDHPNAEKIIAALIDLREYFYHSD